MIPYVLDTAQPLPRPKPFQAVSEFSGQANGKVATLTWRIVGPAAAYLTLERLQHGKEQDYKIVAGKISATATSVTDTLPDDNTVYEYRIFAVYADAQRSQFTTTRLAIGNGFILIKPGDGKSINERRPTFQWTGVGAPHDKYQLTIGTATDGNNIPSPIFQKTTPDTSYQIPSLILRPDKDYFWKVSALNDGKPPVDDVGGPSSFSTGDFTKMILPGLHLQKTYEGGEANKGAQFTYTHSDIPARPNTKDPKKGDTFTSNFALIYFPASESISTGSTLSPVIAFEGAIADNPNANGNFLRLRSGFQLDTELDPKGLVRSTWSSLTAKYEISQSNATRTLTAEFLFTPIVPRFGAHKALPQNSRDAIGDSLPPIQLYYEPYIGLDLGGNVDRPKGKARVAELGLETTDTILRIEGEIKAKLLLNSVAAVLDIPQVDLYADDKLYCLALQDGATRNVFTAGIEFLVNSNVSLDFHYLVGRDAPEFNKVESLNVALGIRF